MRVIRACHELGIEAVAIYSTADRDRLVGRRRRSRGLRRAAVGDRELPEDPERRRGGDHDGLRRGPPRLRLPEREPRVRAGLLRQRHRVRRPVARVDGGARRQVAREGRDGAPGCRSCPARREPARRARGRAVAANAGFPVLLKAAAGGGGRGMRLVEDPDDLEELYATAAAEADAAFGDAGLYLEKAVVDAHHVEVQVLGDGRGGALVLGDRECSVQRRHQKLMEEGPSPFLTAETRTRMHEAALEAVLDALPERRYHRVPGRARPALLLHGNEHPPPGRAPGHRRGDGRRPGARAAPRRRRRAAVRARA